MADTPLDTSYFPGTPDNPSFYRDQVALPGRVRKAGRANTPNGFVDLLKQNEQGDLVVENIARIADLLEAMNDKLDVLIEASASLR